MHRRMLNCLSAEGPRKGRSIQPSRPVVEIVRAERLARLSGHDVHRGTIKVSKVYGDPLRRPVVASIGFYRPLVSIQRDDSRPGNTLRQDGSQPPYASEDGVLEVRREFFGTCPRADFE